MIRITLLILCIVGGTAFAQGVQMFADIEEHGDSGSSSPGQFATAGSTLFFTADDGIHGQELWRTDGTEANTRLVADLTPGPGYSNIQTLGAAGSDLYFLLQVSQETQLWKVSESSAPSKVYSLPSGAFIDREQTGSWRNFFFFSTYGADRKLSVWWTQGTAATTIRFTGVTPEANPQFTAAGNFLYFLGFDSSHGHELWKTDGTVAGTAIVKDIVAGGESSYPGPMHALGNNLIFNAGESAHGFEIWRTDGSAAGTQLIQDLNPGPDNGDPLEFTAIAGPALLFTANDSSNKTQLWKIDSLSHCSIVKKIAVEFLTSLGERAVFVAPTPQTGKELWVSDGTPDGTHLIVDLVPGRSDSNLESFMVTGNKAYFNSYSSDIYGLVATDGTKEGTTILKRFMDEAGSLGNYLYFDDFDVASHAGGELLKSDGTNAGTKLVKDIRVDNGSSNPSYLTAFGSYLYFGAYQDRVRGLWRTDGVTPPQLFLQDNVYPLKRLNPDTALISSQIGNLYSFHNGSNPQKIRSFSYIGPLSYNPTGGKLFFIARTGPPDHSDLWYTNGTEEGTKRISIFSYTAAVTGKGAFYGGRCDASEGCTIFRTTGSKPVVYGKLPTQSGFYIREMFFAGGHLYVAIQARKTYELWITDGTPGSTRKVMDLPASLYQFKVVYPNLFFVSYATPPSTWCVNLLTKKVISLNFQDNRWPTNLLGILGKDLIYSQAGRLWHSDGTTSGKSFATVDQTYASARIGNRIYFSASSPATGVEPWVTDGTTAGTKRLADIYAGPYSSYSNYFALLNDYVYFAAEDGTHGTEIWRTPIQ